MDRIVEPLGYNLAKFDQPAEADGGSGGIPKRGGEFGGGGKDKR